MNLINKIRTLSLILLLIFFIAGYSLGEDDSKSDTRALIGEKVITNPEKIKDRKAREGCYLYFLDKN